MACIGSALEPITGYSEPRLKHDDQGVPSQRNVGSMFQARIAPLLCNMIPRGWTRFALKKYYWLRCRRW